MKKPLFTTVLRRSAGTMTLIGALMGSGCIQDETDARFTGNIIAEASAGAAHIVFVDEGEGRVGVAEISKVGQPSIVMDLSRREHASPLEIFLATAGEGEQAPAILIENHRDIASRQGREDLAPRHLAPRLGERESPEHGPSFWQTEGTTACTSAGWEGANGVWGNPIDSWDNVFTISTTPYSNNVIYPRSKVITQLAGWNGGSGSFHSHGACISSDSGADDLITFSVFNNANVLVFSTPLSENIGDDDYVIYNDWIGTVGHKTTSRITNAGNAAASFRHSAAAWVPNPQ